ncbi:hypothetical protein PHISCL_02259 [Aspergillus sclerotialis]|uniref:HhH-GPD domain-containing protein n=1 Tax=Aspergillus sclerotialis TaxID=2070753 RepID=A0A3A2ZQE2_9EURO|nr:hypothetical protein PHISCL_02259 [Aspergillus sclerotialis]
MNGQSDSDKAFKTRPRHAKSPYFPARRRSERLSKNASRTITHENEDPEQHNNNHVVNGDGNDTAEEKENGHPPQSQSNGYDYDNANGDAGQVGDAIAEEDILLASIEPDSRDQLLQFIASHPFLRRGWYPVLKSERRRFTEDLVKEAREIGLDEGAFDGLMKYVRRTYLELYANITSGLDVTGDGSEFGDEIDDLAEAAQKEDKGARKRKRESTGQPNVTTRGRKKARPSAEGDFDSGRSSSSTKHHAMRMENYQELESVSIPSGTLNLGTPSLGTPIRGTPAPGALTQENHQEIDSPSVANGTPASNDNSVAYEAHSANYDRNEAMSNIETHHAQEATRSAVEPPIPQEQGDALNPQTEDTPAEDIQMENTQDESTQAEDVQAEVTRMEGVETRNTSAEDIQVDDNRVEDTQLQDSRAQDSQAEDTQAEDIQAEDTQTQNREGEDTQEGSIRAKNIPAENPREEHGPTLGTQTEPAQEETPQNECIQPEAKHAQDPQEDTHAETSVEEVIYPKDSQAGDTQAEDTSEWEELPSILGNSGSNKKDKSSPLRDSPTYPSPGQSASAIPNPRHPNAREKSPQKTSDNSKKQPSARTARNYRKRLFRRRRISQRKRELADLKLQQLPTPNHVPNDSGKEAIEGNPSGLAENNDGFTQQGVTSGDEEKSKYFLNLRKNRINRKGVSRRKNRTNQDRPSTSKYLSTETLRDMVEDVDLPSEFYMTESSSSDVPSDISSIEDNSPLHPSQPLRTPDQTMDSEPKTTVSPGKLPQHIKPSRPKLPKVSRYFPKPLFDPDSCLPFPSIDTPTFGLIQEQLAHDPFRLLLATIFLNRTRGGVALPVLFKVFGQYPTVEAMATAECSNLVSMIHCLGFQNQRAKKCISLAQMWISNPPSKGKRYRKIHYPQKQDGRDVGNEECIGDDDSRVAWEIAHLPGVGAYSLDSWRIFCRDELRGLADDWKGTGAKSPDFVPEWKSVLPHDKELRAYLTWMWLKEGWVWDRQTGQRTRASDKMMQAARKGGVAHEEDGNWVLETSPVKAANGLHGLE